MNVVFTVGRVKHLWRVVRIFLLGDAHVDADVRIAERIVFERDVQLVVLGQPRLYTVLTECNFHVNALQVAFGGLATSTTLRLVHCLTPASIHLIVLLLITAALCLHLLELRLHALHLSLCVRLWLILILLLDSRLLSRVLLLLGIHALFLRLLTLLLLMLLLALPIIIVPIACVVI